MPFAVRYTMKMLLYPQYWRDLEMTHVFHYFQIDGITITGTKVKLMVATSIVSSVINPENTVNPLICSSLFNDACQEKGNFIYYLPTSSLKNLIRKGDVKFFLWIGFSHVSLHSYLFLFLYYADPVYLELCLEGISGKSISSIATVSNILNISTVEMFLLNDFQQAFIVSGPEDDSTRFAATSYLRYYATI